jgi:nucleoside phosphorylase/tetratricopeptide (TPR) repeat protein
MDKRAQSFDVCIVCALPEEARAFLEVTGQRGEGAIEERISPRYQYSYRSATIKNNKGESLDLHISWLSRYGPQEMVLHLSHILEEYQPRIALMTGICAGDRQRVQLGDLVVAERIFTYDNGKFILDEYGRRVHDLDTMTYQLDANILQFLGLFDDWKPLIAGLQWSASASKEREGVCHIKAMASGSTVRADNPFEDVRVPVRSTVAIDMEGAAFGLVMSRHPLIPWLIIKGVCDYADGNKNDLYHEYTARASALYALSFIRAYVTNERLPRSDGPSPSSRDGPSPAWNIPYPHNSFFAGRENVLTQLADVLKTGQATALSQPQAISGLGGIGKTQIAVEFAYQHRDEYQFVLWTLADTRESLVSGYVAIAGLLNLPEKDEQDQTKTVQSVIRWFETHTEWLLILDNADDLVQVYEFLPLKLGGHLLLTTRAQATGTRALRIEVDSMPQDVGALFLLRRAKLIAIDAKLTDADTADVATAREVCEELGGLPLALDQAGAYIEETGRSLSDYLDLLKQEQRTLLERRGTVPADHPQSVATTFSLTFEKVRQKSEAAAELLKLCSCLAPDAIPLELITQGTNHLGIVLGEVSTNILQFDQALEILQAYSLVQRDGKNCTLSIHRLVQAVLRDSMGRDAEKQWKQRAVQAVSAASPDVKDAEQWDACEQWVPHALKCATWIQDEKLYNEENASLLNKAGYYLDDRARYSEAEVLYQLSLTIRVQVLGATHHETASSLTNLGLLYRNQEKYAEAESVLTDAWKICEPWFTTEHFDTARVDQAALTLNNLALLYYDQEKYAEAEPLYVRVLAICEQQLGAEPLTTALILDNLGNLYVQQKKYAEAEPLLKRALAIREPIQSQHPDMARSLNNLAKLYQNQGKYVEAEPLYVRALSIYKHVSVQEHPDVQKVRTNYDKLLRTLGRDEEVKKLEEDA